MYYDAARQIASWQLRGSVSPSRCGLHGLLRGKAWAGKSVQVFCAVVCQMEKRALAVKGMWLPPTG